jgi:hypothetical protein
LLRVVPSFLPSFLHRCSHRPSSNSCAVKTLFVLRNMSKAVRILSYLEAYEQRQQEAQVVWKRAQWNLTKAKQRKGVTAMDALTAVNVREELRPRCVLLVEENINNKEADLVDEEAEERSPSPASPPCNTHRPHFRLVDPIEQARLEKERIQKADAAAAAAAVAAKADTSGSTKDSSLRNRKVTANAAGKEEASTWTVTNHEDADNLVDEETKLRAVDPLDLFGFPTRELRQAQQDARRAVEVYMEAANLLLALQAELKSA